MLTPRRIVAAVAVAVVSAMPSLAAADCADPPRPKVDWRRCVMGKRDFSDVNLTDAQLKDGRFLRSIFAGAKLAGVDARRAKFIEVEAAGAVFDAARLNGADFTKADLTGASFRKANLTDTQFYGAKLAGADFTGAIMRDTVLSGADLSGARWIDGDTICAEGSISQCN